MTERHKINRDADASSTVWPGILFGYPARLFFYGLVAFAVCQLVFVAIRENGIAFAAIENGPVEQAQVWMALFASGCLFFAARRIKVARPGFILCACMIGYAAARECDTWFEQALFDDAYKYLAGIPLLVIALTALYRGRKQFISGSLPLVRTPAITIFSIAGIYICSICQVIDRPDLWAAIGEGPAAETTKAAVEEFAELFGYLLMAFSGVESVAMALKAGKTEVIEEIPAPKIFQAA